MGELFDRWLEHLERLGRSPKTIEGYRSLVRSSIGPALGHVRLTDLTGADLDAFYTQLWRKGLAGNTIHHHHACLSAALRQAVRWELIDRPATRLATAPALRTAEVNPPSLNDVRRVLADLRSRDPDFAAMVHVAATTGCRRGELCALRWADLDLPRATLTVRRALVETRSLGVIEKDPKTHRPRRVALDESTVSVLRDLRRRAEGRGRAGDGSVLLDDDAFVWSKAADGTTPVRPDQVSGAWRRTVRRLGITGRWHDLRHFSATALASRGVDIRTIAGRLGHAQPTLTLRTYAHFLEAADRHAADVMADLDLQARTDSGDRRHPV